MTTRFGRSLCCLACGLLTVYGTSTYPPLQMSTTSHRLLQLSKDTRKDFTFAQYWQETLNFSDYRKSLPQLILSDLADKLGVGDSCRTKGLVNLLAFPTILLPIGYWTHSWFGQVTKGSKEKSSVAFDFRYCILAGAVGCFVTRDEDLTDAIKEIPGHNVTVFSMPELIHEL